VSCTVEILLKLLCHEDAVLFSTLKEGSGNLFG